jgi:hypothetical protein
VDVEGARRLKAMIEERQLRHWRRARAVQAGLQEHADPDAEYLVRCRDSVREYQSKTGRRFAKSLVDGRWELVADSHVPATADGA